MLSKIWIAFHIMNFSRDDNPQTQISMKYYSSLSEHLQFIYELSNCHPIKYGKEFQSSS